MATGYMGMEEPEVVPKGTPEMTPPTEQTYSNPIQQTQEPVVAEIAEPPKEVPKAETVIPKTETTEPVTDAPAADAPPTPQVVEKVVEKIIEKYPEFKDENAKELYDRFVSGDTDGIYNYLSEIKKNYDTMSHIDVVREGLAKKHPQWSPADVELELRSEYGKQLEPFDMNDFDKELDPEAYKEAVAHNERADANKLKLERDSRDYRISLKEAQKTIELPKIKTDEPVVAATGPTQEQLDEAARNWREAADKQVADLADYKFEVGDDKNPEEVVFAVTPEDKTARIEAMKTWNGKDFMAQRGWQNADGSFNLLSIAKDVHTLENIGKMQKSAYTQGVTNGRKLEVATIKNIDTEQVRNTAIPEVAADAGELIWG